MLQIYTFFFFNDTATTEIYTRSIVGSVRCVQETGINAEYMGMEEKKLYVDPNFLQKEESESEEEDNPRVMSGVKESDSNADMNQSYGETYISPINNDSYHLQILTLVKIPPDKALSQHYYEHVPQIEKQDLLCLDLFSSQQDAFGKDKEKSALPRSLLQGLPTQISVPNLYERSCHLSLANLVLQRQIKKLVADRSRIVEKLQKIKEEELNEEKSLGSSRAFEIGDRSQISKQKRHRRMVIEIERHYTCPNPTCFKSYGSEGSLSQHIKLKHPQLSLSSKQSPASSSSQSKDAR
eukprot:TRINITY_DN2612_c0_g2_i1.p1 TRINITY_DN2612_c0_g2~~TRINITY_DN2612_c0_g2_i1.p1  ORF type:complete len:295 (+),score=54.45 TRINITY_DN2612_c0_g2_i1:80-964(+)